MWGRAKGGSRGQIPGSLASQARPLDLILERGGGGRSLKFSWPGCILQMVMTAAGMGWGSGRRPLRFWCEMMESLPRHWYKERGGGTRFRKYL